MSMYKRAQIAQAAERAARVAAKRQHLIDMAAERRRARTAIVRRSGQQKVWPVHPTARRG